jgi:hypothetical protein
VFVCAQEGAELELLSEGRNVVMSMLIDIRVRWMPKFSISGIWHRHYDV